MVFTGITTVRPEKRGGLPHSLRTSLASLVVAAVTVGFGLRFFLFIRHYAVNVFYWDQWGFLEPFFHHSPGVRELFFEQWGPHREGIGLIADKFLYPATRWNTRAESFMIGACIFAALLVALLLKRKLFGSLSYSDAVIPMIFLNLTQYGILIRTPNPAYSGFPLLMIMLYCLALLHHNRPLRYGMVLLLNFLLIYTGFGLFMGVVTLGVFALEGYLGVRRIIQGSLALSIAGFFIAAISLGSFFVHYRFLPAVDCFAITPHYVSLYPKFMAKMFAYFVVPAGDSAPVTIIGAGILLAMITMLGIQVFHLLKYDLSSERPLIGAILLSYALLYSANTAVGRVCVGIAAAFQSRYVTLLIPAFLALYFYLLSRPWRGMRPLALGLFAVLILPKALYVPHSAIPYAEAKRTWVACYKRTEDIAYCNRLTNLMIDNEPKRDRLKEKLDYLKQHRLNLFSELGSR
jgi:hypothetical protein